MYEDTDKRRIYWLIDQYLNGKIIAWDFTTFYFSCYNVEMDSDFLTPTEDKLFSELSAIAGRFTDIQEDLIKYPGTYFSEKELKPKVIEVKAILQENGDWQKAMATIDRS